MEEQNSTTENAVIDPVIEETTAKTEPQAVNDAGLNVVNVEFNGAVTQTAPNTGPEIGSEGETEKPAEPVAVAAGVSAGRELFQDFEMNKRRDLPAFMKLVAASAIFHLVAFGALTQAPTVVEKTCASTDFTQKVCDTLYVTALLVKTGGGFVDKDYDPTQIPDGDITMLDVSNMDRFQYPEGYFEQVREIDGVSDGLGVVDEMIGGTGSATGTGSIFSAPGGSTATPGSTFGSQSGSSIGGSTGGLDLSAPAQLPKNKGGVIGPAPKSPFGSVGSTSTRIPKTGKNSTLSNESPDKLPDLGGEDTAETPAKPKNDTKGVVAKQNTKPTQPKKADDDEDGAFNKRPLKDFRDKLVVWREGGGVNIYQQFAYSLSGNIDKNTGKLTVKGVPAFTGDPKMQEVVKAAFSAISDSGILRYLNGLGSNSVLVNFTQDGSQFNVGIESNVGSEAKARSVSSGLKVLIQAGIAKNQANVDEDAANKRQANDLSTLELLKKLQVTNDGDKLLLNISAPNDFAESLYNSFKLDSEKKSNNPGGNGSPNGMAANTAKNLDARQ
jgi:hypothetical protein